MPWDVTVTQDGKIWRDLRGEVRLQKRPFTLGFRLPGPLTVQLNVMNSDRCQQLVNPGWILDLKKNGYRKHPFVKGMGMAEAPLNANEELSLGDDGHHYLYYRGVDDHRWSKVQATAEGMEFERRVSRLWIDGQCVPIEQFSGRLHFLLLVKQRDDGVVGSDELKKLVLAF